MFRRYIIQGRSERVTSPAFVQGYGVYGGTIIFCDKAETLPNDVPIYVWPTVLWKRHR